MNKWPGALFLGFLHPAVAQNKTLISNIDFVRSMAALMLLSQVYGSPHDIGSDLWQPS